MDLLGILNMEVQAGTTIKVCECASVSFIINPSVAQQSNYFLGKALKNSLKIIIKFII